MHGPLALHVFLLEPFVVPLQVLHGVVQTFVLRVLLHIPAGTLHGLIQAIHVLALLIALETQLGVARAFIPRVFFRSLFDTPDGLLADPILLSRLGLGGGRFVGRSCDGYTG
jgi:hypothetical protein